MVDGKGEPVWYGTYIVAFLRYLNNPRLQNEWPSQCWSKYCVQSVGDNYLAILPIENTNRSAHSISTRFKNWRKNEYVGSSATRNYGYMVIYLRFSLDPSQVKNMIHEQI